jgi:dTDP-4-amino-4,6-dideoxygalactose transaminase
MHATIPMLDLTREHAILGDEIQRAWRAVLHDMHLLNGPEAAAFESEIAAYLGSAHARGTSSGTDALVLGLAALGIGRGDRVILPANAFIAALEAVHHLGATPVLVDVEPDGFGPDRAAIERALPAAAVLVVHLYGAPLDLRPLAALCRDAGCHLVEDASHAHGARRAGRFAGTVGAVGCFSAGVVKNLGAYGDAGFVVTDDAALAAAITVLQRHGQQKKNTHTRYGWNCRLDELQAAVLRIKLRHLEPRNARRRAIADAYSAGFARLDDLRTPPVAADEVPVYHQYVIRTPRREALQAHLASAGIETGIHYPVPLHRQPAWQRTYGNDEHHPHAERLATEILSLPVFPELTDAEVERVIEATTAFFRPRSARADRAEAGTAVAEP